MCSFTTNGLRIAHKWFANRTPTSSAVICLGLRLFPVPHRSYQSLGGLDAALIKVMPVGGFRLYQVMR